MPAVDPIPSGATRSNPNFAAAAEAVVAALPHFIDQLNAVVAAMNFNAVTATSTTSVFIAGTGQKTFTVDVSKSFLAGMSVKIVRTSAPANGMYGTVNSYVPGTGVLVVDITGQFGCVLILFILGLKCANADPVCF